MNIEALQSKFQLVGFTRKNFGSFPLRVILLLVIFSAGYYLFFLAPKIALSKAYLKAEGLFMEHRANLLQNRIAFVGLARLDANSANVNGEKIDLFAMLKKTNEEGLRLLDEKNELADFKGIPSEQSKFFNNDLRGTFPSLLGEERTILEEQKRLIPDLGSFDAATANLLNYRAEQDLGKLDMVLQKEEIVTRAANAKEGIGKTSEKLIALSMKSSEVEVLLVEIKKTQTVLDDLVLQLKKVNIRKAGVSREEAIKRFSELQKNILSARASIISSETSAKLLTRETNLILEYDFWLKKIDNYQVKLVKK